MALVLPADLLQTCLYALNSMIDATQVDSDFGLFNLLLSLENGQLHLQLKVLLLLKGGPNHCRYYLLGLGDRLDSIQVLTLPLQCPAQHKQTPSHHVPIGLGVLPCLGNEFQSLLWLVHN